MVLRSNHLSIQYSVCVLLNKMNRNYTAASPAVFSTGLVLSHASACLVDPIEYFLVKQQVYKILVDHSYGFCQLHFKGDLYAPKMEHSIFF